ncbi:MAG: FMN-binding protein [Eubacteriaceae bacterium]
MKRNKFVAIIVVVLCVLFMGTGCSTTGYTDGTYEGSSDAGMHAGLKVSVVVENGEISEVNVVEHSETDGIGTVAVAKLPDMIVEAQSTEVDTVSGASKSSAAIIEAVNNALAQAE